MCLAIALSIQDTAARSFAGLPLSNDVASTARTVSHSTVNSCSCQYLSQQEQFTTTMDRAATSSSACDSSLNSAQKLVSHAAGHCSSSRHEYDLPKSLAADEANIESVFEPRPPHPLSSPPVTRSGQRCALAHDESVTVLDPWRRRPSSLDHAAHKSLGTHRSESCGITSKKSKSSSRRRRSCGNHLPHRNLADIGYLSDRTVSPVSKAAEHDSITGRPSVHAAADSLDLLISSDILESMLQGAEGYCPATEVAEQGESSVCPDDCTMDQVAGKDDCDSVFL